MNEFERLLKSQPLRELPPEWRRDMLPSSVATEETRTVSSWRDWFWPSPLAWGAMAAVWLIFLGGELSLLRGGDGADPGAVSNTLNSNEESNTPRAFVLTGEQELLLANLR